MDSNQFIERLLDKVADRIVDRVLPAGQGQGAVDVESIVTQTRAALSTAQQSKILALPSGDEPPRRRGSVSELDVLHYIARARNPLSMKEIQDKTGLSQVTANKKVNYLKEKGFVKRVQEGRTPRYKSTDSGDQIDRDSRGSAS